MKRSYRLASALVGFFVSSLLVSASSFAQGPDCTGIPSVDTLDVTLELVSDELSRPVLVTAPPGEESRIFVVEQSGAIRIIDISTDEVFERPFLDLADRVVCCGELGLLGLAFHPRYAENGELFVNYTRAPGGVCDAAPPPGCPQERTAETVISRFRVSDDPDVADPGTEEVLLTFCQPFGNHNAGALAFGPHDGLLYAATGDGGDAGDPCNSGQRRDTFLGKILRIDVDGRAGERAYAIPPGNPFVDDPETRDEIWALGLRNPWRMAFDAGGPDGDGRGDLYIADVGQGAWEEIDVQEAGDPPGANYEWRRREGDHAYSATTALTVGAPTSPAYEYPHGSGFLKGCSITGGIVYRGCRLPALRGAYFFADYCNDWVASFRLVDGEVTDVRDWTEALNSGIAPLRVDRTTSFGVDGTGELYVCCLPSRVYRLVAATSAGDSAFLRGDSNADGLVDLSDAVYTLLALFAGAPASACQDAPDADDSGDLDVSDVVWTLAFLFQGGPPPLDPGAAVCSGDPTPEDALSCESFPPCTG